MFFGDGTLATLTLNREQSVTSFARHDIGGTVMSTLCLPTTTGADKLFFLVNRNGTVQIEQLKEDLLLDSVKTLTVVKAGNAKTVTDPLISQLGDQVSTYYKDDDNLYVVPITSRNGNTLTIDVADDVDTIYIGRKFTSRVSLFPPEVQGSPATSNPSLFKINYINLYMYRSINPKINGQIVEMKEFNENLFNPPEPVTGSKRIEMNGWNTFDNFKLIIEQDEPLPLHITALVLEHNFNDR